MIIGIDASRANKEHKSGTEWYSYYLIRWLAKLDKNNQYILYTDKALRGGLLDLSTEQFYDEEDNTEIKIDKKGWQEIKSPYNNFKAKILNWPFDYLWTQGRFSLEMFMHKVDALFIPAHALPVIHPEYTIVTIHDIGFEKFDKLYCQDEMGPQSGSSRKLLNLLVRIYTKGKYRANSCDYLRWFTEFSLKNATNIITVSEFTKNEIINQYKTDSKKISVIHNGYNKLLFKKIENHEKLIDTLMKYGIEGPYLLYVGRIEKKKNIPLLIEAFAIMLNNNKDIKHKLVLAGDASYGYDEVNYVVNEFNLMDKVIMPGWIDETDMPDLFSGSDGFVFPSNYEGFGIPLLQAMACGVPIIASNTSSIPEVVGEAAILFDPSYAFSIAQAMETIIVDKKKAEKLRAKGLERVKNYSWQKTAEETLKLINSIKN